MKKLFLFLLVISTPLWAAAGDRYISNPNTDKKIVIMQPVGPATPLVSFTVGSGEFGAFFYLDIGSGLTATINGEILFHQISGAGTLAGTGNMVGF